MSFAQKAAIVLDRTAVLFIGLALGGVITFSFFTPGEAGRAEHSGDLARPAPAMAAEAAVPLQPGARLASAVQENRTIHVGVFGDSFGDGIWAALYRQLPADQQFEVHQFSHQATGFTRYRTTNLLDDTRAKIDRQPIDIAVLSYGANDTQGIFLDGHGAEYMSDRWQQIVGERVTAVVQLLRNRGVMVFWVGLPRMRDAAYDAQIQQMNGFYARQMQQLGVPYFPTLPQSVDGDGNYAPYLVNPASGERISARANDGIHMTINGYGILTRTLSERIRGMVAQARGGSAPIQQARDGAAARPGAGEAAAGARSRS